MEYGFVPQYASSIPEHEENYHFTCSQGVFEPYTPSEYQQDWTYAPEQQLLGGYQQLPTFNAPPGFVTPQSSGAQYPIPHDMLQQCLQNQAEHPSVLTKQFEELKNLLDCGTKKIEAITSRSQYLVNDDYCISPQDTVVEETPSDFDLPLPKTYAVSTEDSDIQEGEGYALHVQTKKQKLEVKLNQRTQPTDQVKPTVMQPPEIPNLNLPISNTPTVLSNDIGEDLDKTVHLLWKTPLEAEEVIQDFDLLSECTADENPVMRYAARVGTVITLSYPTKSSAETAVGMVGKALEHPCEDFIVVECISEEHLGIASTNEVSITEPRTILFEKIRMKEFRGWFYDEYDPGDTWIHC